MKIKAQEIIYDSGYNGVMTPDDLDKILDLTTDDALTIALSHIDDQKNLDPIWYDKLMEKLGDTQQAAFTIRCLL